MNNIIYGIILYAIIIVSLVFLKPNLIYDHSKEKYKEFGTDYNKTIFTLPIISIFSAIFIAVFFGVCSTKKEKQINVDNTDNTNKTNKAENIKYIVIPYYPIGNQQL